MRGAQRNLKFHGAWMSVKSPMVRMSKPRNFSHAGMAIQTSPSGSPEANDWRATEPMRRFLKANERLSQVPGRFFGVERAMGPL
jgi:hypothetical protein